MPRIKRQPRVKKEPRSDDDPHTTASMGTSQRPITIDEVPVDFGAPPTRTVEGGMVLESLRERMERVKRGQGFKKEKQGAGTRVKSVDLRQTDPRPRTSDRPGTETKERFKKEGR